MHEVSTFLDVIIYIVNVLAQYPYLIMSQHQIHICPSQRHTRSLCSQLPRATSSPKHRSSACYRICHSLQYK
jgi:hypothetical protein